MLKRFNLSEWALRHQSFILYCIVALGLIGAFSYERLGQSEDPPFTFKVMVVQTQWPITRLLRIAHGRRTSTVSSNIVLPTGSAQRGRYPGWS